MKKNDEHFHHEAHEAHEGHEERPGCAGNDLNCKNDDHLHRRGAEAAEDDSFQKEIS